MPDRLPGKRVLVVEDNVVLAYDLDDILRERGAEVVGPAHDLATGLSLARENELDGAILDIDLCGEFVWPLASELQNHCVPFVFVSAERVDELPEDFRGATLLSKPAPSGEILARFADIISIR